MVALERVDSAYVQAVAPKFSVAHSIPGRVRLRFKQKDAGEAVRLALRLAGHPDVSRVRWCEPACSLTLQFAREVDLDYLLASAPPHPPLGMVARARVEYADYRLLGQCSLLAVSFLATLTGIEVVVWAVALLGATPSMFGSDRRSPKALVKPALYLAPVLLGAGLAGELLTAGAAMLPNQVSRRRRPTLSS